MNHKDLRELGLKATGPRLKILQVLEASNPHHLSAEELHSRLKAAGEDVGLATVYRVLAQFEAAGLVVRHNFEGGRSVFELDQGEHHDHLVCVICEKVEEFVDEEIEKRQAEIAKRYQFKITDHDLTIYGVCESCRSRESGNPGK